MVNYRLIRQLKEVAKTKAPLRDKERVYKDLISRLKLDSKPKGVPMGVIGTIIVVLLIIWLASLVF